MAMEAVVLDQSMSACKQMRTMGRRSSIISSENVAPHINIHGGLLQAPHPPPHHLLNIYRLQQQQFQPPLLPLPVSKPLHHSLPSRTRSLTRPPTARKTNNARSQSLTPKKPKSKPCKKEDINSMPQCFLITSTTRLGPDPNDLPKDVTKVLSSSGKTSLIGGVGLGEDMDNFSTSIFTLAPPPSSLPLPRFSLKQPRLRCKGEAVGIDAGATDNLCRLLRLR